MSCQAAITELLSLSARLGRDPLLVQASSGNTSIKLDGTLWIKASGKWLAHANEETLVPIDLAALRENLRASPVPSEFTGTGAWLDGTWVRASIETAMHAVLPWRVVIHVHSVNTISWAVRLDGPERLAERLEGFHWSWIPYVSSGLPLARLIEKAIDTDASRNVFVLANHGLVICGESCDAAEALLSLVERRLAAPVRTNPDWDRALLTRINAESRWDLPESADLHTLATDPVSRRILRGGILYPCQAMFLGSGRPPTCGSGSLSCKPNSDQDRFAVPASVLIVDNCGVRVRGNLTDAESEMLAGLMQVVQRVDPSAPIRYLTQSEVLNLVDKEMAR